MAYDLNSKNKMMLVGNVGQSPDFHHLDAGRKVANITICTNEGYTNEDGERIEKQVWHRATAFGTQADRIEKSGIVAGSKVMLEGRMNYSEREVLKDGVTHVYHNATLIIEDSMNLTPKPANAPAPAAAEEKAPVADKAKGKKAA